MLQQYIAAKIERNLQAKVVNGPLGKDRDGSNSKILSPLTSPKPIPVPPFHTSPLTSSKPVPIPLPPIETDSSAVDDKESDSDHVRTSVKSTPKKRWIVGKRALGKFERSFEEAQKKELEDLKGMQIVKNRLANRKKTHSQASRMFNRRVNYSRSKTSILLTGSEPDQEDLMKAMRHMNRFVIDKFLQTQSRNRRVLERLNSIQVLSLIHI